MSLTTESQAARVIPFTSESCDYNELARLRDENTQLRAQLEAAKAYGERMRKYVEQCEITMEQLTPGDYVLFTNGDWVSMATAQRAIHKAEVDSREGQTAIAVTVHKVCTEYEVR